MSVWLFDLGNTRLKCAPLLPDGRLGAVVAVPHADPAFEARLEQALPPRFDVAHLASVTPPALTVRVLEVLGRRCSRISLARTQRALAGVRIAYPEPRRLGVDRFLGLLATHAEGQGAALLVGVGTAITVDLLDATGLHHGGRIAPSPTLMREALHARAPHLPQEGGHYTAFARDTDDALASGCEGAALALVEQSLHEAVARLGAPPRLLVHGGGAAGLMPHWPRAQAVPDLVLRGLAVWARSETPVDA
ncbi:type III pantothenate kinase [Lysobacter olei]